MYEKFMEALKSLGKLTVTPLCSSKGCGTKHTSLT